MTKPTAAVYLRVSTDRQTAENQRADVLRLVESRGFAPVFYEEAESAAKARPVLDHLLADVRRGQHRAVAFWALDRAHRSMVATIEMVLELDRLGIPVLSTRELWLDTAGPVRSLLVAIFGWVAEQERTRLRERTRAGLARARSQGKRLGAPGLPPALIERGATLVREGLSVARAAREAGRHRCGRETCAKCRTRGGHTLSARSLARYLATRQNPPSGGPAPGTADQGLTSP